MVKKFKEKHSHVYEFILFNLFSNIATIINFIVLNFSYSILFSGLVKTEFSFWLFNYTSENGGLASFLSFLLSYFSAQAVNFYVQRKLVFNSNNHLGNAIPIYIFTVLIVYLICLYVPTIIIPILSNQFSLQLSNNLANAVNIAVQVIIIYPVLKFVVMKKIPTTY